jgi:hypothetical protein
VSNLAILSRPAGRGPGLLAAAAVASATAFVLAPRALAGRPGDDFADQRALVRAVDPAFVEFWRSGDADLPPHLKGLVDYWFRYHVVKAVTAAVLLAVLALLGTRLWTAFRHGRHLGPGRRTALATAAVLVTVLGVFSVALVMANVQGALAPLSSLLTLLDPSPPAGDLAATLDEVRRQLAGYPRAGRPAAVMVADFGRYHAVMVVIASVLAGTGGVLTVGFWRRRLRASAVLAAGLSLGLVLLAVANHTVASDPAPALLAFYRGGW